MNFVSSKKDLEKNIKTLEKYLTSSNFEYQEFALKLIRRGRCFVVVKKSNGYEFYPSRFMGYENNNKKYHESNWEKDGRDTNKIINRILLTKPQDRVQLSSQK